MRADLPAWRVALNWVCGVEMVEEGAVVEAPPPKVPLTKPQLLHTPGGPQSGGGGGGGGRLPAGAGLEEECCKCKRRPGDGSGNVLLGILCIAKGIALENIFLCRVEML